MDTWNINHPSLNCINLKGFSETRRKIYSVSVFLIFASHQQQQQQQQLSA